MTSVSERLQPCDYSLISAFSLVMRFNGRCPNRKLASVPLARPSHQFRQNRSCKQSWPGDPICWCVLKPLLWDPQKGCEYRKRKTCWDVRLSHLACQDNLAYPSFEHLQMIDETCIQVLALLLVSEQVHVRSSNQFAQRCVSRHAFLLLLRWGSSVIQTFVTSTNLCCCNNNCRGCWDIRERRQLSMRFARYASQAWGTMLPLSISQTIWLLHAAKYSWSLLTWMRLLLLSLCSTDWRCR